MKKAKLFELGFLVAEREGLSNSFAKRKFDWASLRYGSNGCSTPISRNKKRASQSEALFFGGERGIRTLGTRLGYTRFPGVPFQPLMHLSGLKPALQGPCSTEASQRRGAKLAISYESLRSPRMFSMIFWLASEGLSGSTNTINLVIAASVVMSPPLNTPILLNSELVLYKPCCTLPELH